MRSKKPIAPAVLQHLSAKTPANSYVTFMKSGIVKAAKKVVAGATVSEKCATNGWLAETMFRHCIRN